MKFWWKTFRLLLLFSGLTLLVAAIIYFLLHHVLHINFVVGSLLTCILAITILYLVFYWIVYKRKYYQIADKYIESVDLVQNVLFFIFFPYFGIILSVGDVPGYLTVLREVIGGTLLILKATMMIIKYTVKHEPLAEID